MDGLPNSLAAAGVALLCPTLPSLGADRRRGAKLKEMRNSERPPYTTIYPTHQQKEGRAGPAGFGSPLGCVGRSNAQQSSSERIIRYANQRRPKPRLALAGAGVTLTARRSRAPTRTFPPKQGQGIMHFSQPFYANPGLPRRGKAGDWRAPKLPTTRS